MVQNNEKIIDCVVLGKVCDNICHNCRCSPGVFSPSRCIPHNLIIENLQKHYYSYLSVGNYYEMLLATTEFL